MTSLLPNIGLVPLRHVVRLGADRDGLLAHQDQGRGRDDFGVDQMMAQSAPTKTEITDNPLCPHCGTPMQVYVMAQHVLRNGRVDSYCPSCALVTCKHQDTFTASLADQ